jgi:hypothetical protein
MRGDAEEVMDGVSEMQRGEQNSNTAYNIQNPHFIFSFSELRYYSITIGLAVRSEHCRD